MGSCLDPFVVYQAVMSLTDADPEELNWQPSANCQEILRMDINSTEASSKLGPLQT